LFRELAHQRLFVAGDTEFNEAFATAVAEEGLRRWLESRGDPGATREHEARNHRTEEFVGLVAAARDRLESLYEPTGSHAIPAAEMRLRKQAVLDQLRRDYAGLRQRWGAGTDYERWFAQNLNNAQLNTVDTYYQLVPAFRQMLRARDGDLEAFFADARAVSRLNKKARHVKLAAAALAAPAAEGSGAAPSLDAKP